MAKEETVILDQAGIAGAESVLIDLGQQPAAGFGQPQAVGLEHFVRYLLPIRRYFESDVAVVNGNFTDSVLGPGREGDQHEDKETGGQHRQRERYHLGAGA